MLASVPLASTNATPELSYVQLFALGGINEEGRMSDGERTLREILKGPDAATRLQFTISHASPAGQLYALLGLRLTDRATYTRALQTLKRRNAQVEVARGCVHDRESFRKLLSEIDTGRYDRELSRPPW